MDLISPHVSNQLEDFYCLVDKMITVNLPIATKKLTVTQYINRDDEECPYINSIKFEKFLNLYSILDRFYCE